MRHKIFAFKGCDLEIVRFIAEVVDKGGTIIINEPTYDHNKRKIVNLVVYRKKSLI